MTDTDDLEDYESDGNAPHGENSDEEMADDPVDE
jgi:hypothetical protein